MLVFSVLGKVTLEKICRSLPFVSKIYVAVSAKVSTRLNRHIKKLTLYYLTPPIRTRLATQSISASSRRFWTLRYSID